MAYLKKNVNGFLLFLVILLIICFAGFTYYFRARFTEFSSEYYQKKNALEDIQKQVEDQQAKLKQTNDELANKDQRESELTGQYKDVKGAKETCDQNLASTTVALKTTQSTLDSTSRQLRQSEAQLQQAAQDITDLRDENNAFRNQRDQCQADLASCRDSGTG